MTAVGIDFFGIHIKNIDQVSWPKLFIGHTRLWDTKYGGGATHWSDIETARGVYNWTAPDGAVAALVLQKIPINYTFGYVPAWANGTTGNWDRTVPPIDPQDFYDFVDAFSKRYAGKIKFYPVWNEMAGTATYWTGTQAQMLAYEQNVARIIHANDPTALILTPSVTNQTGVAGMDSYLAAGGGAHADIMNIHGYQWRNTPTSRPEQMWNMISTYTAMFNYYGHGAKPFYVDEGSFGNGVVVGTDNLIAFTAIYLTLQSSGGVTRTCWYQFDSADGNPWGQFYDATLPLELKPQGLAARIWQSWTIGATWVTPIARIAGSNGVRNPTFTGGVAGSPGTAPTNMSLGGDVNTHGMTVTLGFGTDADTGKAYMDITVAGTNTAGAAGKVQVKFESSSQIVATTGQTITVAADVKLQGGSTTGITTSLQFNQNLANGTFSSSGLYWPFTPLPYPLGSPRQSYMEIADDVNVARAQPLLSINYDTVTPVAVNITLRVSLPDQDTGNVWYGEFTRPASSGQPTQAAIVWDQSGGPSTYTVPVWATNWRDLKGNLGSISGGTIQATNLPVILENAASKTFLL